MLTPDDIQIIRTLFREETAPIYARLDKLERRFEGLLNEMTDIVKDIYLEIAKLREDIDLLKNDVGILKQEMKFVKTSLTSLENKSHSSEIRVYKLLIDIKTDLKEIIPYKRILHEHDIRLQRLEKIAPAN